MRAIKNHPFMTVGVIAVMTAAAVVLFLRIGSHQPEPDDVVLAQVGDRAITVGDFRMNYEFGYPHLKRGADGVARKRAYLDAMVGELLLANDGFSRGLADAPRVHVNDQRVLDELLIEELIRVEVVERTTVSDQEVRDAVNRSKARFKLRYWGEPTQLRAMGVRMAMLRDGYMRVADSLRAMHADIPTDPSMFESDYLNAFDVDPVVLDAVKDLGAGDISMPVPMNSGFYVFQVVDVRREGIMEHEYAAKFESVKKVLLNTKYDEGIARYVEGFMTPQNVVTRGEPFWKLCDAVVAWKASGDHQTMMLREAIAVHAARPAYAALRTVLDQPLVTYKGGQRTVRQFLDVFWPSLRDIDTVTTARTRHLLSEQVGLTMRDQLLAAEARRRGMDRAPAVAHERLKWLEKTVYEEVRDEAAAMAPAAVAAGAVRAILQRRADSLKAAYPVTIRYEILDTLTVSDSPASRQMGLQLFKLGSKRLAVPVTDGIWGAGL
ncbi:MAG: peptidyl-prolyl cis-trans isomerase [Ignavibacteriae bacterium]|nr:peptidyl-prolyl cis-trans isomerase [Ignavibacteriota bacterium]